jgi:hypothetical protein
MDQPTSPADPIGNASLAKRLRRVSREDAMQTLPFSDLAQAYRSGQAVYLGRGQWWDWAIDGIPEWLIPDLRDLGFLP